MDIFELNTRMQEVPKLAANDDIRVDWDKEHLGFNKIELFNIFIVWKYSNLKVQKAPFKGPHQPKHNKQPEID